MTNVTFPYTLTAGQPENVNQLNSNLAAITTVVNGNLDADNITAATAEKAGLSQAGTTRRGKKIIATEESASSTSYTTLTTPDTVSGIVLPTDGLLCIGYQAMWKESAQGVGYAAIFLGTNQLKMALKIGANADQEARMNVAPAATYYPLASFDGGLASMDGTTGGAYGGPVTTGQVLGLKTSGGEGDSYAGFCTVFAAAGTYDVSIKFKASSGSVSVKDRRLWVWTMGF